MSESQFMTYGSQDDRDRVADNEGRLYRESIPGSPPHGPLRPIVLIEPERVTGPQLVAGDNIFRFKTEVRGFEIGNYSGADFTRAAGRDRSRAGNMVVFNNTSRAEDVATKEIHIFVPAGSASINAFVNDEFKGVAIEGWL